MWGIRAIRVGMFLGGLLVAVALVGCQSWKGTAAPTAPATGDDKDPERVLSEWKRGGGFKDQPEHLTPERIHGGIY